MYPPKHVRQRYLGRESSEAPSSAPNQRGSWGRLQDISETCGQLQKDGMVWCFEGHATRDVFQRNE
jgi:hypothetical protein